MKPFLAVSAPQAKKSSKGVGLEVPQVTNHQRIVDAICMGNPQLAEQVVIHVTNHFMEHYLEVWDQ